jgi:fructuronate reductase
MRRLSSRTLPDGLRRPAYDRAALTPGIVHLGLGAFSRCHLTEYTEDALEHAFGPWGIRAVNLRPPALEPMLGPQDHLYIRELREGPARDRRVIGAICDALTVTDTATLTKALSWVADPATRVVTMTVTEKGYCHIPATGALDLTHPDILNDIAHPETPRSLPGFILRAITLIRAMGHTPPAFLSGDNVPGNGRTLSGAVLGLAAQTDPATVRWIEDNVAFPDTMVDRIAPATKPADIAALATDTGVEDQALVIGEPFRMWVIEDDPRLRLPAWDATGMILTTDVAAYEAIKMRVLNGMQTGLSHLAHMAGHVTTAAMMADPVFAAFARRTISAEVTPSLPQAKGIDHAAYLDESIHRLTNTALEHTTAQISTDGSRKIRQRLLEPLMASHHPAPGLEIEVAGWIEHATRFAAADMAITDPIIPAITRIFTETGNDPTRIVPAILSLTEVFPPTLTGQPGLTGRLTAIVQALRTKGPRAVMQAHLTT